MMTFRQKPFLNRLHEVGRIRKGRPWRGTLAPSPHGEDGPLFNQTKKVRKLFGIAGILAGLYACSSAALGEIEEEGSRGAGDSSSNIAVLSGNGVTTSFIDIFTYDGSAEYSLAVDAYHDGIGSILHNGEVSVGRYPRIPSSKDPKGFDEVRIPETVWSLDVNTGTHLDRVSDSLDSEIYAILTSNAEIPDAWIKAIFGFWNDKNVDNRSGSPFGPLEIHVASCGENSAEHSDMSYCRYSNYLDDQEKIKTKRSSYINDDTLEQVNNNQNTLPNGQNTVPNSPSSPDANLQPNLESVIPATTNELLLHGNFSLLGPCGGVPASCLIIQIGALESPIPTLPKDTTPATSSSDNLTSPVDSSDAEGPTPGPIIYLEDPAPPPPDLPPVFTPQPVKSIPETSTWVMTAIGFGAMALAFKRKRRPRMNPISIIDVTEAS